MEQKIWNAAQFITWWQGEDWGRRKMIYKLYRVPRDVIDHGEKGTVPLLIGIDTLGIREVDVLVDTAYDRVLDYSDQEDLIVALQSAPEEVSTVIKKAVGKLPEP